MLSAKEISVLGTSENINISEDGTLNLPGYSLLEFCDSAFNELISIDGLWSKSSTNSHISHSNRNLDLEENYVYDGKLYNSDTYKLGLNFDKFDLKSCSEGKGLEFTNCNEIYLNGDNIELIGNIISWNTIKKYLSSKNNLDITLCATDSQSKIEISFDFSNQNYTQAKINVRYNYAFSIEWDIDEYEKKKNILIYMTGFDEKVVIDTDNQILFTNKFSNKGNNDGIVIKNNNTSLTLQVDEAYSTSLLVGTELKIDEENIFDIKNPTTAKIDIKNKDLHLISKDQNITIVKNGNTSDGITYETAELEDRYFEPDPNTNNINLTRILRTDQATDYVVILTGLLILTAGTPTGNGSYPGDMDNNSEISIQFSLISCSEKDRITGKRLWKTCDINPISGKTQKKYTDILKYGYLRGYGYKEFSSMLKWKQNNVALIWNIENDPNYGTYVKFKLWRADLGNNSPINDFNGKIVGLYLDTIIKKELNSKSFEIITCENI